MLEPNLNKILKDGDLNKLHHNLQWEIKLAATIYAKGWIKRAFFLWELEDGYTGDAIQRLEKDIDKQLGNPLQ